ncbi:hypothetical protein BHU72_05140 [Desulfuribacillus stibiiarsenatis]|uniref:Polymerase beta nucleotidyltransferase domain-containing protein n=1 Tax=Desulfuribacillus stibiiarsenatis TaxID=1390249 RepID=A0A1E5L5P0_9FIRM|nr:hypothetical protein [Desulfuribacillus stibiiarsenatis]OEH85472.1 hypothetical protein BHU72_05140 [Desulfuribacillus stibiiarsenatis]
MVPDRIREMIIDITSQYGEILKITLFKKDVKGVYNRRADINLAIETNGISEERWKELYQSLENELGTLLFFAIFRWEEFPQESQATIAESGLLIYEKQA